MIIKFPVPDQKIISDPAGLTIIYAGVVEEKKDKAIMELLSEYGIKLRGMEHDSLKSGHRLIFVTIPRKYLKHAISKLKIAKFYSEEGTLYEKHRGN